MDFFNRDFYTNSLNLVKNNFISCSRKKCHWIILKQNACSKIVAVYEYWNFPMDGVQS